MRAGPIAVGMLFALMLAPSGALSLRSPSAARPAVSARNFAPAVADYTPPRPPPAPTMQFGRTSRSASPMARGRPSEEELFGVQLLGGTVGFVLLGPALLGSACSGSSSALLARALVASAGKRGAQAREAGWQTYQLWREGRTRAEAAWETCRGLRASAGRRRRGGVRGGEGRRRGSRRVRGFDIVGASAKYANAVWRRAVAWAEANGAAAARRRRGQSAWRRGGRRR